MRGWLLTSSEGAGRGERASRRRRGQSSGGKNKPSRELAAINKRLSELAERVLRGEVDRADAAVAGQLLNYVLRGISIGLKAKEQQEFAERLEALEEALPQKGVSPWRA